MKAEMTRLFEQETAKALVKLEGMTVDAFRKFVGNGIFTAVFRKKDGTVRTMNARLKVKKFVKGTQPEVTAKRNETLKAQNMIGVYEMAGTATGVAEENYRTLNLETLIALRANGEILENEVANREGWEGWD